MKTEKTIFRNGWESLGFRSYQEYLLSDFWREKRAWILECFGNKCQRCGSEEKLIVHHLSYINVGNEGMDDVTVLCKACHKKEHGKQ